MIISASRRTDIPAFFSEWMMERVRAGYCTVFNPFNRKQVAQVSLLPEDVDVFVFWTKDPSPLLPHLPEFTERGLRFYFQFTLNPYGQTFEPNLPPLATRVQTFKDLAGAVGPDKVIWRYDPIILSNQTDLSYHREQFALLAHALKNSTHRVAISIVDNYRKAATNFKRLAEKGVKVDETPDRGKVADLVSYLAKVAASSGLEIYSCAETIDLSPYGVLPGKCIDDQYIEKVFGLKLAASKDRNQRDECGCIVSKDIGIYDTCLHGCSYCYAGTLAAAQKNCEQHFVDSPSLIGRFELTNTSKQEQPEQLRLF